MSIRFHKYGVLLVFLGLGVATGCESQRNDVAGPSPVSASLTSGASTTFHFEPATLRPEVVPGTSCVAFGTRIIVVIAGGSDVTLRGLRFRFTDRHGVNALPRVVAIPGASPLTVPASSISSPFPIPTPGLAPLPATSPIPMPGPPVVNGLVPAGPQQQLPFFLFFDCGVAPAGMLFIATEVAEPRGTMQTSEFRVRVGS
jgi:hypothetical protein